MSTEPLKALTRLTQEKAAMAAGADYVDVEGRPPPSRCSPVGGDRRTGWLLWLALSLLLLLSAALVLSVLAHSSSPRHHHLSARKHSSHQNSSNPEDAEASNIQQDEPAATEEMPSFQLDLPEAMVTQIAETAEDGQQLALVGEKDPLDSDPSKKSVLPLASNPAIFNETSWSSYRPQLYFGLKNRRPDSPVFGLMWYRQKSAPSAERIALRNWAMHEDDVVFMWNMHDGRSFGSQRIADGDLGIRTEWLSFGASSWMARLYINRHDWAPAHEDSFVLYFALQDQQSAMRLGGGDRPGPGGELNFVDGNSPAVHGNFSLRVRSVASTAESEADWSLSELGIHTAPMADMAKVAELVKAQLHLQPDGRFDFGNRSGGEEGTNFAALQITVRENAIVELLFQAGEDKPAEAFTDMFRQREEQFRLNFNHAFPIAKSAPAIYHKMGHAALSNLLGGIGVWHGNCWMRSSAFSPPDSVKAYGPLSLMSAVPSRTGFPRGFIWDEGFHNLLIHKFDPELTIQILGAYLDMMNVDGWIPREIAIGTEAEARMPGFFLVQEDWVANPPMFFFVLRDMVNNEELVNRYSPDLLRMYPRMKQLFLWLRNTQQGPKPGTFRWRGRNATTNLELNPATLASGFDDFPRATHPTDQEYHLDIRCWLAMSANVLVHLAQIAGDSQFLPAIREEANRLNDVDSLDQLHWSDRTQRFVDYGLHSESVELVPEKTAQGETILVRKVLKEPRYGFVENVNGYANLFPLLMKMLPPDSSRLPPILRQITDPEEFWTPYGLRSISTLSPYYNAYNSNESAPYWRGGIWINMNYFALDALRHYGSVEGPHKGDCARVYNELREKVMTNMASQYEKTGFLWEHYNDRDGHGEGQHPFTGWTTLILKIMSESY